MDEMKKTLSFVAVAAVMVLLALVTAPKRVTPDAFLDQGEPFFPEFTDPNAARTLEVIDFDEETGSARPFKVTFSGGRWTIPSHHDYPADGANRLAETAAGVIGIKKDDFRSDRVSDHGRCGVIDPLDETAMDLEGRGQRITIKGENDVVLADFIVGKEIEGRDNMRFVRVPGKKRVYAARMDLDISTKFKDWIESDLLQVKADAIEVVTFRDYSIDERTGIVDERDVFTLTKEDDTWSADGLGPNQEIDQTKMKSFLRTLEGLSINGVRPKPAGLSAALTASGDSLRVTTSEMLSLQSKGYFFSRDGRLLSNEGELQARTNQGVTYTLRFGEVVSGTGMAVTAGVGQGDESEGDDEGGENRYLFITTAFERALFPEPPKPANTDYQAKPDSVWTDEDRRNKERHEAHLVWEHQIEEGSKRSRELNSRFADWYYVISAKSFDELSLTRSDLVRKKDS